MGRNIIFSPENIDLIVSEHRKICESFLHIKDECNQSVAFFAMLGINSGSFIEGNLDSDKIKEKIGFCKEQRGHLESDATMMGEICKDTRSIIESLKNIECCMEQAMCRDPFSKLPPTPPPSPPPVLLPPQPLITSKDLGYGPHLHSCPEYSWPPYGRHQNQKYPNSSRVCYSGGFSL